MTDPRLPFDPERVGGFEVLPEMSNPFEVLMGEYGVLINEGIARYCSDERERLEHETDPLVHAASIAYLNTLEAGGGRERGALAMFAYLEWGRGVDQEAALALALHVEMVQAYVLIVDDIDDGSDLRRGQLAAHKQVEAELRDDANPRGTRPSMSSNEIERATKLQAEAYQLLSYEEPFLGLNADPLKLMQSMNISRKITALTATGQNKDISNRRNLQETEDHTLARYVEKTALHAYIAPLLIGKTAAEGSLSDQEAHYIHEFGKHLGVAFQLKDDLKIIESYREEGDEQPAPGDKDVAADIRNGTITPLVLYALDPHNENVSDAERRFLRTILLDDQKILKRDQLRRCQEIFYHSGAVDHVEVLAADYARQAVSVLDEAVERCKWPPNIAYFLRQLAL